MKIKKKYKKDLVISVPHAMHARNLFCSSFNFKETSLILGNFSSEVKKKLKKKTMSDIKNFNLIHLLQSKMISFYSIILDKEKKIDKNIFLKLVVKNYKNCDPNYKEIFKHHIDNNFNKIFFFILKILFIKHILSFLILTSSILIYYPMLVKYKPKKIFFACSNSSLDKGLIFLKKIFKFKIYGLINSWDHLSTKRFLNIHDFDKLFIWNEYFKKELKHIHNFDLKKSNIVGIPYYDFKRKRYKKKNVLTFFMSNPQLMDSKKQLEVIEFLEKFCVKNNLILYIRPHPGIKHVGLDNYKKRKKIKILTPKRISMNLKKTINDHNFFDKDLDKLLQESKVVINFHSTTSLDSIFHLTPVINLSLDKKVNWFYQIPYYKFVLNFKAISLVRSFKTLNKTLNLYLKNTNLNQKNISKLKKYYFGKFNPKSGELISKIIYNN